MERERKMPAQERGVSLIELLVVMSIVGVLATLAAPSLSSFVDSTRLNGATNLLLGDLNRARSEAIKRNGRVLLCIRNAAGNACATTTNWAVGWLVCADLDADGTCDANTASDPNPMLVRGPLDSKLTMAFNGTTSVSAIRFNANGSTTEQSQFTLRKGTTGTAKTVSIQTTGSITTP